MTARAGARLIVVVAAGVAAAGTQSLSRAGYTPDEEFTVFAARGIAAHGLPLLPSGLLYDRGILYSYASWLAHAITGSELPAYRALSVACAPLSLWLIIKLMARLHSTRAGIIAAGLVAASIPFWATATSARFYAPFLAVYLATLVSLGNLWLLTALSFLARLTHELAFTLAAIPVVCWLVDRGNGRHWIRASLAIVAGLILGFIMTKVIPQFQTMFDDMDTALPAPTQMLLTFSETVQTYWWAVPAVIFLMIVSIKAIARSEKGGLALDQFKLKAPIFGQIVRKSTISRFWFVTISAAEYIWAVLPIISRY